MARVVGGRDAATVRRLYGQLEHLNDCLFYTDDWEAWAKVWLPERHVIGKKYTIAIEPDNSNTRHHLGENDPKKEDCQPVRGDDQPFREVMACGGYSRDFH